MTFAIRINVAEIEAAAAALGKVDGAALQAAATRAVNETTRKFGTKSKKLMNFGINLTDAYVSGRMALVEAPVSSNPQASITARGDLTILGHYAPVILVAPVASGRKVRGDPKRGIPAGFKARGVSVEVTRGARKEIEGAFTLTLKRGIEAGFQDGVFIREGGRLKHLYGVAPYSLFRATVDAQQQILADDLADELLTDIGEVLQ